MGAAIKKALNWPNSDRLARSFVEAIEETADTVLSRRFDTSEGREWLAEHLRRHGWRCSPPPVARSRRAVK